MFKAKRANAKSTGPKSSFDDDAARNPAGNTEGQVEPAKESVDRSQLRKGKGEADTASSCRMSGREQSGADKTMGMAGSAGCATVEPLAEDLTVEPLAEDLLLGALGVDGLVGAHVSLGRRGLVVGNHRRYLRLHPPRARACRLQLGQTSPDEDVDLQAVQRQ